MRIRAALIVAVAAAVACGGNGVRRVGGDVEAPDAGRAAPPEPAGAVAGDAGVSDPPDGGAGAPGPTDGGADAGAPGPTDGGGDAGLPGPTDGGADAGLPGPTDGGTDAGVPGPADGGADAGVPGPNDGGTDAGTPGPTDGGTGDAGVPGGASSCSDVMPASIPASLTYSLASSPAAGCAYSASNLSGRIAVGALNTDTMGPTQPQRWPILDVTTGQQVAYLGSDGADLRVMPQPHGFTLVEHQSLPPDVQSLNFHWDSESPPQRGADYDNGPASKWQFAPYPGGGTVLIHYSVNAGWFSVAYLLYDQGGSLLVPERLVAVVDGTLPPDGERAAAVSDAGNTLVLLGGDLCTELWVTPSGGSHGIFPLRSCGRGPWTLLPLAGGGVVSWTAASGSYVDLFPDGAAPEALPPWLQARQHDLPFERIPGGRGYAISAVDANGQPGGFEVLTNDGSSCGSIPVYGTVGLDGTVLRGAPLSAAGTCDYRWWPHLFE